MTAFTSISHQIWDMKYRFKSEDGTPIDQTIPDTLCRVATALAEPEQNSEFWKEKFYKALKRYYSEIHYIIHLAGQAGVRHSIKYPEEYIKHNILAYVKLLEFLPNIAPV